ncbi:MAG: multiheme c-type cytochrome [bacterium JZ-2024 1]
MRFLRRKSGEIMLGIAVGMVGLMMIAAPAHDVPERWKYPHSIRGGLMTSSNYEETRRCAQCHHTFARQWETNHGLSWKRQSFQYFYRQILETTGKEYEVNCITCHAPIAVAENRYTVPTDIDKEGVSCDFCHSLVLKETGQYETRPGKVKRGPRHPAYEASHGILYDRTYGKSEFCTGCHIWKSSGGVTILDEFQFWGSTKEAAEGKECQTCHMPKAEGFASDFGGFERPDVSQHTFLSSDDISFVKSAITLNVKFERDNNNPQVGKIIVTISNTGVAHMFPGGLSWRRYDLVLRIRNAEGDKVYWAQSETFKKTFADSKGNPTLEDWKAHSVLSDTRLKPGETRTLSYTVDLSSLPTDEPYYVSAQLFQARLPAEVYDYLGQARRLPTPMMSTFAPIR